MRTLISIACLAALGGCAIIVNPNDGDFQVHTAFDSDKAAVEGNGMSARDERIVGALPHLQVDGSMVVDVRVGAGAPVVVVEADGNLLPLIHTEARGDTLRIWNDRIKSKAPVHITYNVPTLTEVKSNGSGRIAVVGLNGAPLDVHLNGSGMVQLSGEVARLDATVNGPGRIDAGQLRTDGAELTVNGSGSLMAGQVHGDHATVAVHGSGQVQAHGAVHSLNVRVTGSGNADLDRLVSDHADLSSSSSGGISATVRQDLVAHSSSSGAIRVHGNPMQRTISGKSVYLLD